jgi:hypothetical protein
MADLVSVRFSNGLTPWSATPYEFTGREPGLRPGCLTQEPSKTTLTEATQL